MGTKIVEVPSRLQQIFALTNDKSTPIPAVKIKYFVGLTSATSNRQSLQDRISKQHQAYGELTGQIGFSKGEWVSVKGSYQFTYGTSTASETSQMSMQELVNNVELELELGEVAPGKGLYVYQPVLFLDKVLLELKALIVTDTPLSDLNITVIIAGEEVHKVRICSLQCHADAQLTKALTYYADAPEIYMGDNWVLHDPANRSGQWRLEQCEGFGKDVFWIIHQDTGKLLTWYPGVDVYAGDAWVKEKPHDQGAAALWRIYPVDLDGDAHYIQSFRHPDKLLSWSPGQKLYAGDDWVKNDPKARLSSLWRIRTLQGT